jgi:hypothetical protein
VSPEDAARLRGPVARSLETYPDYPGLLLLRATTEALARSSDSSLVLENIDAFLGRSREDYDLAGISIASAIGESVHVVHSKNSEMSFAIERRYLESLPSDEELRRFIQAAGIGATQIAPWRLLRSTASSLAY